MPDCTCNLKSQLENAIGLLISLHSNRVKADVNCRMPLQQTSNCAFTTQLVIAILAFARVAWLILGHSFAQNIKDIEEWHGLDFQENFRAGSHPESNEVSIARQSRLFPNAGSHCVLLHRSIQYAHLC